MRHQGFIVGFTKCLRSADCTVQFRTIVIFSLFHVQLSLFILNKRDLYARSNRFLKFYISDPREMKAEESKAILAQSVIKISDLNEIEATNTEDENKSINEISEDEKYINMRLARNQNTKSQRQVCGGGTTMTSCPIPQETKGLQKPIPQETKGLKKHSNNPPKKSKTKTKMSSNKSNNS